MVGKLFEGKGYRHGVILSRRYVDGFGRVGILAVGKPAGRRLDPHLVGGGCGRRCIRGVRNRPVIIALAIRGSNRNRPGADRGRVFRQ